MGGSQPVLCPMEVKYVKVSLNLRNSRDEMSKGAPTRGVLLLQMAHFDDPYPCILAQAGPTSWTGKLKILSFSSNLMAWFKHSHLKPAAIRVYSLRNLFYILPKFPVGWQWI